MVGEGRHGRKGHDGWDGTDGWLGAGGHQIFFFFLHDRVGFLCSMRGLFGAHDTVFFGYMTFFFSRYSFSFIVARIMLG